MGKWVGRWYDPLSLLFVTYRGRHMVNKRPKTTLVINERSLSTPRIYPQSGYFLVHNEVVMLAQFGNSKYLLR